MVLSIRQAWETSIYCLNYITKAVCFSDKLKHPDPSATKSGQKTGSGSWGAAPLPAAPFKGCGPICTAGLYQAALREESSSSPRVYKEQAAPVQAWRGSQWARRDSRANTIKRQRTGVRAEGQPGFSTGTKDAKLREQPLTKQCSKITGWQRWARHFC